MSLSGIENLARVLHLERIRLLVMMQTRVSSIPMLELASIDWALPTTL